MYTESVKSDIESPKLNIEDGKSDIQTFEAILKSKEISGIVYKNMFKIFTEIRKDKIFGRRDVINALDCGESTASALLTEMKNLKITKVVNGHGKGKYIFDLKE